MTVLSGFIGTIIGYTIGSALAAFTFRMYEYIRLIKARNKNEHSTMEVTDYEVIETHVDD